MEGRMPVKTVCACGKHPGSWKVWVTATTYTMMCSPCAYAFGAAQLAHSIASVWTPK
jgi:hypothetical protein